MEHFYDKINGWLTFDDLYEEVIKNIKDDGHVVEVGSWHGKSAVFFAVELINSNKKIKFDCVDTWMGSEEHKLNNNIVNNNLYEIFLKNIDPVKHVINPIRLPSIEASKLYKNESLDFVFIDAAHDYQNVKQDINAWYEKVKYGGILAGHDYYSSGFKGVALAVNEFVAERDLQQCFSTKDHPPNYWVIKKT